MGNALLIAANGNNTTPPNAGINISGGGGLTNGSNTIGQVQIKVNVVGVFSNLTAVNSTAGNTTLVETTKNGSLGSQSASVTGAAGNIATFGTDATHTDAVAVGDLVDIQFSPGPPTSGATLIFTATSGHSSFYSSLLTGTVAAGTTKFVSLAGAGATEATESTCQIVVASPGTLSGLQVNIKTNAATTGGMVVFLRKNGANGTQTLVIAAGTTGIVQVSSLLTDTVAVGDLIDISVQSTGTSAVAITLAGVTFTSSGTSNDIFNYNTGTAAELTGLTQYLPIGGDSVIQAAGSSAVETEAQVSYQHGFSGTMSGFSLLVLSNTYTNGATTFQLRKNGANANQVITIPFGSTGLFQDLIHTDAFGPTDVFAVEISTTGTGTKKILVNSWTFSESPTSSGVFNVTISESGTASDNPTSNAIFGVSIAEAGNAAETLNAHKIFSASIIESGSAADAILSTAIFGASLSESGSASDHPSSSAIFGRSLTETGNAGDTSLSAAIFGRSVTETGSALDVSNGVIPPAANETEFIYYMRHRNAR